MNRIFLPLALTMSLSLTGCISFTPTGPIGEPQVKAATSIEHAAQIAEVSISDPGVNAEKRLTASRQLTDQITHYVEKSDYFNKVVVFPVKAGDDDMVLKFDLTSLKGKRSTHPGYIPGAILTLTIWIWVNGPVDVDTFDIAGTLTIEDRHGKQLAKTSEKIDISQNVGIYDRDYWAPRLGANYLNQLVAQLLASATRQLPPSAVQASVAAPALQQAAAQ
ncbi:hypothetical protein [Pseudomonas sp. NA-150]|uniref:hypothetical protein n=1 Tax=Pseudomonas sp. NA-150 TaxID=3367525 RepID=UPI0037C712FA